MRGVKNNILEIFDQCQKKWNIYITSPPAVSRSIAGCFRQGIQGECPKGEGVKPHNQKLLWNLTTISLKEEKYIQEPFANDRPYST